MSESGIGPVATDAADDRSFRETLSRSWRHYRDWRSQIFAVSMVATVASLCEAAVVVMVADLASVALSSNDEASTVAAPLLGWEPEWLVGIALMLVVVRLLAELLAGRWQAGIVSSYDAGQRLRVVEAFERASWPAQSEARRGELMELAGTYLTQTRVATKAFTDVVVAAVGFAVLLAGGIVTGGLAALVIVAVFAVVGVALLPIARWTRRSARQVAAATPDFANRLTEASDLARDVKAFGVTDGSIARVATAVDAVRRAWRGFYFSQAVGPSVVHTTLLVLTVVGLGVIVLSDVSDPASYVAMVLLLYRASQYGRALQGAGQVLVVAGPFRDRLDDEVSRLEGSREPAAVAPMPKLASLRAHDLCFRYEDHPPLLTDVEFEIHAGELVGLVGSSGAGKSTLLNLILRLDSPTGGQLFLNHIDVTTIDLAAWRREIGFVPQEAVLLDATIEDNVRFFRDTDRDQVVDALAAANVLEEVEVLPGGLDFVVGERGGRLSGGQRQRVCLARALVGRPSLLVLDEPTSALDPVSEAKFRQTILGLRGRLTTIVAAHRPETIRACERVLRVDDGRVTVVRPGAASVQQSGRGED
jgi:ABC-type multidrug transport system fused ATPase/permease subunit